MIIELYGIPGAGKTTIINRIKNIDDILYSSRKGIKGLLLVTVKKVSAYLPSSLVYKQKIKKIIGNIDKKPLYTSASIAKNLNSLTMVAFGYRHIRNLVYMDEGLLHRVMTFSINYGISVEKTFQIIDIFEDCMTEVKSYYLKVSIDECYKSIKRRNRHECDMDELNDTGLFEFLLKYEEYSEAICKRYHHTIISRDNYKELK